MMRMPCQTVIDLTHTFADKMSVHPFDERPTLTKLRTLENDDYNDWLLSSGMHVGTHIDGPGHLTDARLQMATIPVERFVGDGLLIDARGKSLDAALLERVPISKEGLIVLIFTGYSALWGASEYFIEHPVIEPDFAKALIKYRVKMVGIDFFSPDKYPFKIHKMFFEHQLLIAENLTNLGQLVGVDNFTVVALPLKLEADSALARVVALV